MGGRFHNTPDATFGERAATAARPRKIAQGTVGAGIGAHAGPLKGGIGSASVVLPSGITVAALVAVNCSGNVFDVRNGELLAIGHGLSGEFDHVRKPNRSEVLAHHAEPSAIRPLNTTLAVIATDAALAKHECTRMAKSGQDGLARAIDPAHQYIEGDIVFTLATGDREVPDEPVAGLIRPGSTRPLQLNAIFAAGADTVARAIVHAVISATSAGGLTSYLDRFPSARTHYARRHA
jgi:L-aminopeptidase/D-esterase-like protein